MCRCRTHWICPAHCHRLDVLEVLVAEVVGVLLALVQAQAEVLVAEVVDVLLAQVQVSPYRHLLRNNT